MCRSAVDKFGLFNVGRRHQVWLAIGNVVMEQARRGSAPVCATDGSIRGRQSLRIASKVPGNGVHHDHWKHQAAKRFFSALSVRHEPRMQVGQIFGRLEAPDYKTNRSVELL